MKWLWSILSGLAIWLVVLACHAFWSSDERGNWT